MTCLGAALLVALLLAAGCATPATTADSRPRARCLSESGAPAGGTRPLIFFLCIESP